MCTGAGVKQYTERYMSGYWKWRKFCADFDAWGRDRQLEYQRQRMVELVSFAAERSPFYKRLYSGVDLSKIETIDDLNKLPVVDKEMLRQNLDDVYTIPARGAVVEHTGGTTGKSLIVRFTRGDFNERMAVLDNFKARVGFEHFRMKRATFNGRHQGMHMVAPGQEERVYWRHNVTCRQMIYSSFDLSEEKLGAYVESLNRFQPDALDGYFTSMCDVASFVSRHNLPLTFKPVAAFPTSETLEPAGRALIEEVFGCKVYDQYASSEGAPFVCECENQRKHVELNSGVFERQESGEVLVTSFTTHGTPLIRYAIGDIMDFVPDEDGCDCGHPGPLVSGIQGRSLDYLYRVDGVKAYAVNVLNALSRLPNSIVRAQFRQRKIGEVTLLLEVDRSLFEEPDVEGILKECALTFGAETEVSVEVVDEIPRAASGKFRMIVNEVDG